MIKAIIHAAVPFEIARELDQIANRKGISISKAVQIVLLEAFRQKVFREVMDMDPDRIHYKLKTASSDFQESIDA